MPKPDHHRFDPSNKQIEHAHLLLERILEDFNPEKFTIAEILAESTQEFRDKPGQRYIQTLMQLGYVEEFQRDVYRVTEEGRRVDFSEVNTFREEGSFDE